MAKEIESQIKLQIPAGQAAPSPPVGPALGQAGVNIMEFCKAFNAQTQAMEPGLPVPVVITAFADKSFTFILKTPPAAELLKKAAKVQKGHGEPSVKDKNGKYTYNFVGEVTTAQIEEIAKIKLPDLNTNKLESAMATVKGTAKNMGIKVVD